MWWFLACHASNTPKHESVPQVEPPLGDLIQVEVGLDIICAIDTTHRLKCWGDHAEEALSHRGYSSTLNEPPEGKYTQVALTHEGNPDTGGPVPACVLGEESEVSCWSQGYSSYPDKVITMGVSGTNICFAMMGGGVSCVKGHSNSIDTSFVQVWAGYYEICALTTEKDLECGQVQSSGELGLIDYPGPWVDVRIGIGDTCMLHQDQGIYCERDGDLLSYFPDAHGTEICIAGSYGYCILQEDGTIDCHLRNFDSPQFDTPLKTISCSYIWEDDDDRHFTACGLVGDGTARCWNDYRGQWSLP